MPKAITNFFVRLIAIAAGSVWAFQSVNAADLQVTLTSGGDTTVVFTLTNPSDEAVSILKWETALEAEIVHDLFAVTASGRGVQVFERAEYIGRTFRRVEADADDFVTIGSGESVSTRVELADYYRIPADGLYNVRYEGEAMIATSAELRSTHGKTSDKPSATIMTGYESQDLVSNSMSLSMARSIGGVIARPPEYNLCTASQQSIIASANDAAEMAASESLNALQTLPEADRNSSPRYDQWFGTYTADRYDRVLNTFDAINTALADEVMSYDCSCDIAGVYAYVYPSQPYDIYLCPVFWAVPQTGADSQSDTIIHEVSHFTIVAGTDDVVYGQSLAENLADSDPDSAISNADNVAYFSSNDPFLPMTGEIEEPTVNEFVTISAGESVSGFVAQIERNYFQSADANMFTLVSVTGDADLEVYSDELLTDLICGSYRASGDDVCDVPAGNASLYVVVEGYEASDYTLTASVSDTEPPASDVIDLPLDVATDGTVAMDAFDTYRIEGASSVTLTTNVGDADLYVFNSTDFNNDTLICQSANDISVQAVETCQVPAGQVLYAVSYGFIDSDYTIEASSSGSSEQYEIVPMNGGDVVEGSVNEGEALFYEVTGATKMILESITGDADLGVFTDETFTETICVSQSVSALDECEIETDVAYVLVFGYTLADFRLTAEADAGVVPETDGGTTGTDTDGGSSTGTDTDGGSSTGTDTDGTGTTGSDTDGGSTGGTSTDGSSTDGGGTTGLGTTGSTGDTTSGTTGSNSSGGGGGGSAGIAMLAMLAGLIGLRRRERVVAST